MKQRRYAIGRALGVMIAAAGLVSLGGTITHADSSDCNGNVSIAVNVNGTTKTISPAQLCAAADVFDTDYQYGTGTQHVIQGTSIRAVLASANVNPGTVNFVDVPRGDGSWITMSGGDLRAPSDFADNVQPVFYSDGGLLKFLLPVRSSSDNNGGDLVVVSGGGTLNVGVHGGPLLTVTATADTAKTTTAAAVTFTAEATGGASGSKPFHFEWTFGDGSTGSGHKVSHPFDTKGTYDAQVSVTGADGAGGVSNNVQITVGPPTKGGTKPGGGTGKKPTDPKTGPAKGHGHQGGGTPETAPVTPVGPVRGSPASTCHRCRATSGSAPSRSPVRSATAPRRYSLSSCRRSPVAW